LHASPARYADFRRSSMAGFVPPEGLLVLLRLETPHEKRNPDDDQKERQQLPIRQKPKSQPEWRIRPRLAELLTRNPQ